MNWTDTVADRIRRNEPISAPLSLALIAATPATRLGMWARKLASRVRVNAHVISVGNISAGGTGKTPAVIRALDRLAADSERVTAVLTRGYGTGNPRDTIASCDVPPARFPEILGDEPALILERHPHVLLIKGRDRIHSARLAIEQHGCNTLVLDDGYQYVRLHRDVNQLVIDATNPFGNRYLIPRGILREPLSAISRATDIVLTRCDQSTQVDSIEQTIRRYSDAPILRTSHRPTTLVHVCDGERLPLDALKGRSVVIASAVGNPSAFRSTVEGLGYRVAEAFEFRDHADIPVDRIPSGSPVVVTEKDAVKMKSAPKEFYALSVSLEPYD